MLRSWLKKCEDDSEVCILNNPRVFSFCCFSCPYCCRLVIQNFIVYSRIFDPFLNSTYYDEMAQGRIIVHLQSSFFFFSSSSFSFLLVFGFGLGLMINISIVVCSSFFLFLFFMFLLAACYCDRGFFINNFSKTFFMGVIYFDDFRRHIILIPKRNYARNASLLLKRLVDAIT